MNTTTVFAPRARETRGGVLLSISTFIIVLMSTMFFANSVVAQCPTGPGWTVGVREYSHPNIPNCVVIVKFCFRLWGLSGPPIPGSPGNHVEIAIQDIEYWGCQGSDQIVLQTYSDDIIKHASGLLNASPTEPCLDEFGAPKTDLPVVVRFYAGDCRTQPIHVGQRRRVDSQGNEYIQQVYVSKNCSVNSQNCVALFTVCLDANGNHVYTRIASSPPPQTVCGTTTVYCEEPACFPPGEITVQCNPFCF